MTATTLPLTEKIVLRGVVDSDFPLLFQQQLDPEANYMAAFTHKDPSDREYFEGHWHRILADPNVVARTILVDGEVAGWVGSWVDKTWLGEPEVTYWIGREYWGRGIATAALLQFLREQKRRPIFARAAKDNLGSLRVLEKCGFRLFGSGKDFANTRDAELEEAYLRLDG